MKLQTNILLAPYTTLKIGGPADYFVIVKSQQELIDALAWAKEKNLPYFILGNGSNILVSDQGFRGLVIQLRVTSYELRGSILRAGAGVSMSAIAKMTAEAGLSGLEFGIGVPGTVGGAIYGNAGAFGQNIKNILKSVNILIPVENFNNCFVNQENCYIVTLLHCYNENWAVAKISNSACSFEYRESIFKRHRKWIILEAEFSLKKDDPDVCQKRMEEMLKNKITHQPMGEMSAGSIFKNPEGQKAWELISEVEMKGYQIGGARVSEKHANYIINTGKATAEQVIMLIAMIKQRVRDRCEVQLQEEIQYVGF